MKKSCLLYTSSIQNELLSKIADIDWYKEEAALALVLCGMGKRSRKGRGRVMPDEYQQKDKAQALAWICDGLNKIAKATSEELKPEEKKYEIRDGTIYPVSYTHLDVYKRQGLQTAL